MVQRCSNYGNHDFFSQFFDPATYTVYRIPISFFPWPCGVAYTPGICKLDEIRSYHMHPISTHKFSNTEEQARCIDGKSQILRVLSCKAKQLLRKHWMKGVLLCVVVFFHLVTHKKLQGNRLNHLRSLFMLWLFMAFLSCEALYDFISWIHPPTPWQFSSHPIPTFDAVSNLRGASSHFTWSKNAGSQRKTCSITMQILLKWIYLSLSHTYYIYFFFAANWPLKGRCTLCMSRLLLTAIALTSPKRWASVLQRCKGYKSSSGIMLGSKHTPPRDLPSRFSTHPYSWLSWPHSWTEYRPWVLGWLVPGRTCHLHFAVNEMWKCRPVERTQPLRSCQQRWLWSPASDT